MKSQNPILNAVLGPLREKLRESLTSVLPVSLLVLALSATPWVNLSHHELLVFLLAAGLLIVGISLFNLGPIWP